MTRDIPPASLPPLERLRRIMHLLRSPGGCPWDAEQTHESLVKHLIEEAYEVAAAIRSGDRDEIVDELGDLLLQPVFHAEIASEEGRFDLDDIANAICEKLIRRHPHVFGEANANTPEAVLAQWEEIKALEKTAPKRIGSGTEEGLSAPGSPAPGSPAPGSPAPGSPAPSYLIRSGNEGLPALMAATKIQRKAATVGFDWPDLPPVLAKVREELDEVAEAIHIGSAEEVAGEIGDLLFAVVNLARKTGHEAELLLHAANGKFVVRLRAVEDKLREAGLRLEEASLEEMDAAWEKVKESEHP